MKLHFDALLKSLAAAYVLLMIGQLKTKWQALSYLYHRNLCEAMEEATPGIAGDAGYEYAVGVLANLAKQEQEQNTAD